MNLLKATIGFVLLGLFVGHAMADKVAIQDWPNLAAYRNANAMLGPPAEDEARVVFMGDSITEFWTKSFWSRTMINRGISGQTTPQMLLRFRPDVIALKPKLVVILAGTNDIAGNTGPASIETIAGNIASMTELAKAHGIAVVLCAVLPAASFYWTPELRPADQIVRLNDAIKAYANLNKLIFIDYYAPMVDERKGLKKEYSEDGVHPNEAGYKLMSGLVLQGIGSAIGTAR
jgi:lysophospholipase L1-like esterase